MLQVYSSSHITFTFAEENGRRDIVSVHNEHGLPRLFCQSAPFSRQTMGNSLSTQEFTAALWLWAPLLPIACLTWIVGRAIYNVYFHPLAGFPGPRMAAATVWWKIHLELVKQESMSLKLWDLHAKYGVFTLGLTLVSNIHQVLNR